MPWPELILGGTERGVAARPLAEEAAQWAPGQLLTVTVPENGASLADRSGLEVTASATSVEEAVQIGVAALLAQDSAGGILLFSPAAPTPRAAGNWQDRSASFREAVLELS